MRQPEKIPRFEEPWQAQLFAAVICLQNAGHLSPVEWSTALGKILEHERKAGGSGGAETYYTQMLNALESILNEKNLVLADELLVRKEAWEDAYRSTPHGSPVNLSR